jgi:HK97 family phage major capsid protein
MPRTLKQLTEQRAPIGAEIRKLSDTLGESKPDFTAEERAQWEKLNADFNRLTRQMEIVRQSDAVDATLGAADPRPKPGTEDTPRRSKKGRKNDAREADEREQMRALVIQAWCRKQSGLSLTAEQVRACKATGFDPRKRSFNVQLSRCALVPGAMQRALSHTTTTAGAYTIPQGFVYNLEKALLDFNGMRQVASIVRTETGNLMPWPTTNDTTNAGSLISGNTVVGEADVVFGQTQFSAYKFTSGMVQVPSELMEDSAFNLADELSVMLGTRIARGQEQSFTGGTGTGRPQGALVGATLGVTAASDTVIAPDEIISLIHSVAFARHTHQSR